MNYLASVFIMFFMVATALMLGLPSDQFGGEISHQYNETYQDEMRNTPSSIYDLLLDKALSLDTLGGSFLLGSLTFALGGSGVIIISMSLLGGMLGMVFDYMTIVNQIIYTLPTPITWVLGGAFFLIIVIGTLRFASGR